MTTRHEVIGSERLGRLGAGEVSLWAAAFVVVLAAEAAAALYLAPLFERPPVAGEPAPAILIDLAPIEVAEAGESELALPPAPAAEPAPVETPEPAEPEPEPIAEPEETPPEPLSEPAVTPPDPEPVAEEVPVPHPVPAEPEAQPDPTPEPEAAPEPVPEPEPAPEPEPEPVPEPATEEEVAESPPLEEPVPDLVPAETPEVAIPIPNTTSRLAELRKQFAEQQAEPEEKAKPEPAKEKQQVKDEKPKTPPKSAAVETPKSETKEKAQTASEPATPPKKKPGVSPKRWQAQVVSHLNRSKRYPSEARRNGEEGVARLQFVIDARGNVLSARIVRSSGSAALDKATLDMVKRASPVPAPPDSMGKDRVTLTVPINFNLK